MKILTVCQGGLVRSVAMKHMLFYYDGLHHDAVPCGLESNTPDTIALLARWADRIIVMQPHFADHPALKDFKEKILRCDVGEDTYGTAFHHELQLRITSWLAQRPADFAQTGA